MAKTTSSTTTSEKPSSSDARTTKDSDREQRDRAREVYQEVIDRSPVQDAAAIWKNVHDHWLPTLRSSEGFDLTPTTIIAEHPDIKKNSVLVPTLRRR